MPPIVLGAGPAGCAAAIVLAQDGAAPILLDRDAEARDALCGGFLSWRTAQQLRALGVDPAALGAARPLRTHASAGNRPTFGAHAPMRLCRRGSTTSSWARSSIDGRGPPSSK